MAVEAFIPIREALITLVANNFTGDGVPALEGRVTAGRGVPIADPTAPITPTADRLPLGVVSLQQVQMENATRHQATRVCDFQVDIILQAAWDTAGGDIVLDNRLDATISKIIEIVQANQTFPVPDVEGGER